MGKQFSNITEKQKEFMCKQKVFFVSTASNDSRINISPKGMDSLRVIDSNKLVWLNLTGSGNETAAHLLKNHRMTIMFCAFENTPLILRLYGNATIYHESDNKFQKYIKLFPKIIGSRQIIEMNVDLTQTSCGFGVPIMNFKEERMQLKSWAEKKGEEQIREYWKKNNSKSIDGFDTKNKN